MRRRLLASAMVTMVLATLLAITPASAATFSIPLALDGTSTKTVPVGVSAQVPLDPLAQAALNVVCAFDPDCPNGIWSVGVDIQDVDLHVQFTQTAAVDSTYTDGLLAEGKTLDVVDTVKPLLGTAHLTADINGEAGAYVDGNPFNVGPFSKTLDLTTVQCVVPAPGAPSSNCDLPPLDLTILSLPMFPGIGVDLAYRLDASLVVDSTGMTTVREYKVVADSDTDPLSFTGATKSDPYAVPCGAAGQDLHLNLSNSALTVDPSIPADLQLVIKYTVVGQTVDDTILTSKPLGSEDFPAAALTDPDTHGVDLGTIAPDTTPPVVTGVQSSYAGQEGSEIPMSATVDDACGADNIVWRFSDGTKQFGPSIKKTFADSGSYTGNVTATDARGNATVKNFTVNVSNVAPVADAGPDGAGAWGRPIAFNGAGTDPGSVDQSTLVYKWAFGDGSPSATGGPSVVHAYAAPGTYTATLTVCDKDGACDDDTRDVVVRKRNTTTSYVGATSATYDTPTSLSGSLVDEFGQAVNGRSLGFSVDGVAKGSSNTNSSGIASVAYTPSESAGSYGTAASFAGDTLYDASSSSGAVSIGQKSTTVTYTGALNGAPNKTTILSAVLKDATGTPLAGRSVAFVVGAQSVSATTDANGVATASLKLSQKNGSYPLTATYTPVGADVGHYLGSAVSKTFKLQAK